MKPVCEQVLCSKLVLNKEILLCGFIPKKNCLETLTC
jgi:hypothetical protein